MENFDRSVSIVMEYLRENRYFREEVWAHSKCFRLLRGYLIDTGQEYSRQASDEWYRTIPQDNYLRSKFKSALTRLGDAFFKGGVANTKEIYRARLTYCALEPWAKNSLDEFLESCSGKYAPGFLCDLKNACARFLDQITKKGCSDISEITHRTVRDFCLDDGHASDDAKKTYNRRARLFLEYLAGKDLIRASIPMSLEMVFQQHIFFIDELSDSDMGPFSKHSCEFALRSDEFSEKSSEFISFLGKTRYANNTNLDYRRSLRSLAIFLEANSLGYSADIGYAWANNLSSRSTQWKLFRRAVMRFEQFRTTGSIAHEKAPVYLNAGAELPLWCKTDFESFMLERIRRGYAKSTLGMYRLSCLRLLEHLIAVGTSSWGDVTPEMLKAFHRNDPHSTPEGRNAYASRIRIFLQYLGEKERLPPTLYMAVPNDAAPRATIVNTLSEKEVEDLRGFAHESDNAYALRDSAILLLGYRTGLRGCDIVQLKFSDIDWDLGEISIQQQKTDKFLKLPLPVEAGNAVFRYLTRGRPDSSSEYIFISHMMPYDRLTNSVCGKALKKALPHHEGGFHDTRKSFASGMLRNGVSFVRIAEALGQSSEATVMRYLSSDGEKMRMCALGLDAVPLKGGRLSER